jgi:HK97 family phage prohead protease
MTAARLASRAAATACGRRLAALRAQQINRTEADVPDARPNEAHFTALDLKSVSADGVFEGYASLFEREDLGHDVVMPGAFRDTLAARGPAGVRMLFQHNPAEPIGVWERLFEDARGLFAQGRLLLDVARAREVFSLMRAGAIDGLSIGFKALRARPDRVRGIRRLEKIDLWEISIVTFPMLPEARVAALKSRPFAARLPTEREFERWLTRDAGLKRSEARAVMREGLKGLASLRDAGRASGPQLAILERIEEATRLLNQP